MTVTLKTYDDRKIIDSLLPTIKADVVDYAKGSTDGVKAMRTIDRVRFLAHDTVTKLKMSPADAEKLVGGILGRLAEDARASGTEGAAQLASVFGVAQTQVQDAAAIRGAYKARLGQFNPHPFESVPSPSPKLFAQQIAAIANWAGSLGAGAAHDYSFMRQVGNTAIADKDARPQDPGNDDSVHKRQDLMPWEVIVDKAETVNDPQMLRVVGKSAIGVQNALRGMAAGLAGLLPAGGDDFEHDIKAMGDPSNVVPAYIFGTSFAAHIERTGHQLKGFLEHVERHPSPTHTTVASTDLKKRFPLAYSALAGAQAFWVKDQLDSESPAFKKFLPFEQLNLETAIANASVVIAALDGAREASRLLGDVFHQGLDSMLPVGDGIRPGEDMYKVQLVLSTSSALAVGALKPQVRNERHAIGVASECSFQIVNRFLRDETASTRAQRMSDVEVVLKRACLQAGEEFYKENGRKADGAWDANLDHFPQLLAALRGEDPDSADKYKPAIGALFQANRVSLEDIADVMVEHFGMPPVDIADLRGALAKANASDDYFVGNLIPGNDKDGKPKQIVPTRAELEALGVKPLTPTERKVLAAGWALCNGTWKQGQAFRSVDDATRRDELARSQVYRPYSTLVGGVDTLKAIYDVAKDHWGLVKAVQKREDYKPASGISSLFQRTSFD